MSQTQTRLMKLFSISNCGDHRVRIILIIIIFYEIFALLIELNKWMEELDRRYKMKLRTNSSTTPSKKRRIGQHSKSHPPNGAPEWAVDPSLKSPPKSGTKLYSI